MKKKRYSHLWFWLFVMVIWFVGLPHVVLCSDACMEKDGNTIKCIKNIDSDDLKFWADVYGLCLSRDINEKNEKIETFTPDLEEVTPGSKNGDSTFLEKLALSPFLKKTTDGKTSKVDYRKFLVDDGEKLSVNKFLGVCQELKANEYLMNQIVFWYPEYHLLFKQKDYIASHTTYKEWFDRLNVPKDTDLPLFRAMVTEEQPEMGKEQWELLKQSMIERWQAPYGLTMGSHVKTWLYQYHTMEHFPGAQPSTVGAHDLRGYRFDKSFSIVGCNFLETDLWEAEFNGCTVLKAEFTGAKVADVLFKNVDLTESKFVGVKDKYGPHFSTFTESDLSRTMWRDAKINGVIFFKTNLQGSRFINCDFSNTLFLTSNLSGVVFENCIFGENVKMYNCCLGAIDLKNTRLPNDIFSVPGKISSKIHKNMLSDDKKPVQEIEGIISHFYDGTESYIGKASYARLKDTANYIFQSLEAARLSWDESIRYKIQGVEGDYLFFFNVEERALYDENLEDYQRWPEKNEAGKERAKRDLQHINEHIKANFLESGRKEAYRQFYVRSQINRDVSIFNNLWLGFEGLSSGFGTRPGRFIFFFGFFLSLGACCLGRHLRVRRMWDTKSLYFICAACLVGYFALTNFDIIRQSKILINHISTSFFMFLVVLASLATGFLLGIFMEKNCIRNVVVSIVNLLAELLPGVDSRAVSIKTKPATDKGDDDTKNGNEEEGVGKWILFIRLLQIYLVYQCTRMLDIWWL